MKKFRTLMMLALIASLSIGFASFAAKCNLVSGKITGKGDLYRNVNDSKVGNATTQITSHDLLYTTTTQLAYDKKGKVLSSDSMTSRTSSYAITFSKKKPYKLYSTHAIKNDKYKPLCSQPLVQY